MKLSEWVLNYRGILAKVARKYIADEVAKLEEELVAWQLRDAEELETLRMRILKAEAENRAWLELCRYFVGGDDEHIKELMCAYLDDPTKC